MNISDDRQLDTLLRSRLNPPAPEGMDEQIIAAAVRVAEARSIRSLRAARPWYADLLQAFIIPKPAYALAAMLVFGVMIGFDIGSISGDSGFSDWTGLFASGETWL